jgi:threonine dehydratase
VETEGTPTLHAALAAGRPVDVEVGGLAASALGARRIGAHAWAVRDRLAGALLVTDAEVAAAQRWLWTHTRLVAEPGGAVALAALLHGRYRPEPTSGSACWSAARTPIPARSPAPASRRGFPL